jgi:ketosteroid isomerase-like protein
MASLVPVGRCKTAALAGVVRGAKVTVTDEDVDRLIEAMDMARARWISGRGEFAEGAPFRQADDMTIFGPFGGPSPQLSPESLATAQAATSAQFHGGEGSCEVVKTIVEGDLVVLVMIERSTVMFEGRDTPHPWVLRTTQIFRRADDQQWIRLHRHADPLVIRRPLDATLEVLEDA